MFKLIVDFNVEMFALNELEILRKYIEINK